MDTIIFSFCYHMYGSTMGTLSIDVSPDSGTTWIESGLFQEIKEISGINLC